MTIICKLQGGFGNHLGNVMLALVFYDKIHMPIYLEGNHIRGDTAYQRNDTRTTIFKVINPSIVTNSIEGLHSFHINSYDTYLTVLENIHAYTHYNLHINIICAGKIKFYRDNLEIISKYITIPLPPEIFTRKNNIIVSLRLGMGINEVSQPSPFEGVLRVPFIYFKDAISKITEKVGTIDSIFICSDNYTDKFLSNFITEYGDKIILLSDKNTLEQCSVLVHGAHVISSNSSFSLTSTMINTVGDIYLPEFRSSGAAYPHSSHSTMRDTLYTWATNMYLIPIND